MARNCNIMNMVHSRQTRQEWVSTRRRASRLPRKHQICRRCIFRPDLHPTCLWRSNRYRQGVGTPFPGCECRAFVHFPLRVIASATVSELYDSSGAAKARVSSAFSRSKRSRFIPFLVAADQVADVFARAFIGSFLAYFVRHVVAQGSAQANGHCG